MNILKNMNPSEILMKGYFKKIHKEGINQLIIDFNKDGEFILTPVSFSDERKTVVTTETYRFLLDFFNKNKQDFSQLNTNKNAK